MTQTTEKPRGEYVVWYPGWQPASFTFDLSPASPHPSQEREAGENAPEQDQRFVWKELKAWAEKNLSATSRARMLIMAENDEMDLKTATSNFVLIRRLLDDELKQQP